MPAINPEDYNIDNFNTQNLGPISVTDFRRYVLNYNLPGLDPVLAQNGIQDFGQGVYVPSLFNPNPSVVDLPNLSEVAFLPSPINDNTTPRPDNKQRNLWTNEKPFYGSPTEEESFDVTTKSLEDPGSIDAWVEEAGFSTDVFSVRNFNNLVNNDYGPQFIETYNDPDQPLESTGYVQYPSSSGEDVLGPIIARSLGFSPESFIDFPSELQSVGTERRATELSNRIALNFVDETVGKLNLDPLGLLAGQSLFLPDFTITKRKGLLGKAAQFTANLTGFNFPKSILPGGDQIIIGSNAFQEDLIDYTGRAQRKLLYSNVYSSKYNPETLTKGWGQEDSGKDTTLNKIGGFFENLNPTKKRGNNYLRLNKKEPDSEPKNLFGKIGRAISDAIVPGDDSLIPLVDKQTNPNDPFIVMGTEGQYPAIQSINNDPNSNFNELDLEQPSIFGGSEGLFTSDDLDLNKPNKTTLKRPNTEELPLGGQADQSSTKSLFYWKSRQEQIGKRGLLDFTQKMVTNASAANNSGAAKYVGRFDDPSNLTTGGNGNLKHDKISKGNLVKNSDDGYYCRSWSTQTPYQTHYSLIRRDRLFRGGGKRNDGSDGDGIKASGPFFGPYQSVLESSGHVKVAPNSATASKPGDDYLADPSLVKGYINTGNDIKRFMFSIENLAWADAPQRMGLDPCEIGPNGGRIMWFPPYDITFTDNTTANWNSEIFIGRAEPIYTYNHTERKGTLSWSIITDHPSVLNSLKEKKEKEIWQFFAGCGVDVSDFFETTETEVITIPQEEPIETPEPEVEPIIKPKPVPREPKEPPVRELNFYFRNATTDAGVKGRKGPNAVGRTIEEELAVNYETGVQNAISKNKKGDYLFLNKEWVENIDSVIDFLATPEGQNWCVEFEGSCSALSTNNYNQILSIDRANRVANYVIQRVKEKGEAGPPPPTSLNPVDLATFISSGQTGTTDYYLFDENNFKRTDYGYKCKDGGPNGASGTVQNALPESAYYKKNLSIDLTKCSEAIYAYSNKKQRGGYWWVAIDEKAKPEGEEALSKEARWIVTSTGEKYSADTDEDGEGIESEDGEGTVTNVSTNSAIRSNTAKESRRVSMKLFKNHERINNTEAALNNIIAAAKEEAANRDKLASIEIEPLPIQPINPIKEYQIPNINGDGSIVGTLRLNSNGKPVDENGIPLLVGNTDQPKLSRKEKRQQEALINLTKAKLEAEKVSNPPITNANAADGGENTDDPEVIESKINEKVIKRNVQKLLKECSYFEEIEKTDPFVYETIKEKIKYFQPAFHSITPQGLNSRLTFLQQCMRQGPSLREGQNQTQNMAFGKPPILVLRIGDFYHTKIVPDSLNINYEPLQWDMNPEGVGVQPMIAKIDLNFSMIGGSSLDGPIRQLQNAVSFNYFANTSVYNPRRYYEGSASIHPDGDGKYSINKKGSWESLEQKLENDAITGEASDGIISTNQLLVGFGAFKNQADANRERYNPLPEQELINSAQDAKPQDSGIQVTNAAPSTPIEVSEDIESIVGPGVGEVEVTGIDPNQSVFSSFGPDGLFGGPEDQQMIKDMYPGAKTPQDDIDDTELYDSYDIKLTELPDTFTETGTISVGNIFFKKPDGSGGIPIKEFGFYLTPEAEDLGYTIQIDVNLKLTYPPNSGIPTENITDRAYIDIAKVITKEGSVYKDYKTLYTDEYNQNSIFDVQRFFTDWFTKDSRFNGVHKLDVSWTFTREVVESTIEQGTEQKVGQLVSKTYTETFEYDLYSEEYQPTPEEAANLLSNLPLGSFFP